MQSGPCVTTHNITCVIVYTDRIVDHAHRVLPMFTAEQLVAHVVGDYVIQSEWMATEKTERVLERMSANRISSGVAGLAIRLARDHH